MKSSNSIQSDKLCYLSGTPEKSHHQIIRKSISQTKLEQFLEQSSSNEIYPDVVESVLMNRLKYLKNLAEIKDVESNSAKVRLARETLDKFTTVAGNSGLRTLKDQLEDVAFLLLNPEARNNIIEQLKACRTTDSNEVVSIDTILEELTEVLYENNLSEFSIEGREKSPFSIWQKMCRKRLNFEDILDIVAFRIIVDTIQECYKVIEILHKVFTPLQGRFKDYIQRCKVDSYKSLHTGIIGPFGKIIEVQVRTKQMNEDISLNLYFNYWRQKTNYY